MLDVDGELSVGSLTVCESVVEGKCAAAAGEGGGGELACLGAVAVEGHCECGGSADEGKARVGAVALAVIAAEDVAVLGCPAGSVGICAVGALGLAVVEAVEVALGVVGNRRGGGRNGAALTVEADDFAACRVLRGVAHVVDKLAEYHYLVAYLDGVFAGKFVAVETIDTVYRQGRRAVGDGVCGIAERCAYLGDR